METGRRGDLGQSLPDAQSERGLPGRRGSLSLSSDAQGRRAGVAGQQHGADFVEYRDRHERPWPQRWLPLWGKTPGRPTQWTAWWDRNWWRAPAATIRRI